MVGTREKEQEIMEKYTLLMVEKWQKEQISA